MGEEGRDEGGGGERGGEGIKDIDGKEKREFFYLLNIILGLWQVFILDPQTSHYRPHLLAHTINPRLDRGVKFQH